MNDENPRELFSFIEKYGIMKFLKAGWASSAQKVIDGVESGPDGLPWLMAEEMFLAAFKELDSDFAAQMGAIASKHNTPPDGIDFGFMEDLTK